MILSFHKTYEITVKKVEDKIAYTKKQWSADTIFWPGSQNRVHYYTAKPEPHQRETMTGSPCQ
jgi:hypothetical protein